ncbi:MAG TPA: hypothetical protein VFL53_17960 [Pseudolabrys sp.]|nr:hypothetical protein [Pseudolabrys sp.]
MTKPTQIRRLALIAGLLLFGYLFNRGVYVGSITMLNTPSGLVVYEKYCHYFSLTGVHDVLVNAGLTEEDAARVFCPLLRGSSNERAIELAPDDL